tara:strand:- start:26 stop:358 length:333 start_codon:yes stop_codon:yes gene_type:complete
MTGGTDYDHTVALFENCGNGYWYKCYEGKPSELGNIWQAAKGYYEYDRQVLHDGKRPPDFYEAHRAAEDLPSYCKGCVRIEMDKLDYGEVFPAFTAVRQMHCEMHNGDNA